jgi:predicted permease
MIVVMFSNGGNYGLSVNSFAFGQAALARATIYYVTSAILMYTVGVLIASSGQSSFHKALAGVFKIPAVYGVLAAIVVMLTQTAVPQVVMRPVQLLGNAALPCMILVLGMQMERTTKFERPLLVGLATFLSLVVTPLLAFGLVSLLGLSGVARQAAMIESSMPAAVVTTILALEYRVAPGFVTGAVFISTLLSPITVTLIIALVRG